MSHQVIHRPDVRVVSEFFENTVEPLLPDFHASLNETSGFFCSVQAGPRSGEYRGGIQLNRQTWDSAKGVTCVECDGVDDYVWWDHNYTLDFILDTAFTFSCLVKQSSTALGGGTLFKKKNGTGTGYVFFFSASGLASVQVTDLLLNQATNSHTSAGDLRDDTWHHLVARYDPVLRTLDLFVDGVKDEMTGVIMVSLENNEDFTVGEQHNVAQFNWYEGLIDELSCWRRPLLDLEVATLFAGTGL